MWTRNGETFAAVPVVVLDGRRIYNPTPAQIVAAGYEVFAMPQTPPPKRYSKLALYDALGAARWAAIRAALTDEQRTRLDLATELSTGDADFAAALEQMRDTVENADVLLAGAEI